MVLPVGTVIEGKILKLKRSSFGGGIDYRLFSNNPVGKR